MINLNFKLIKLTVRSVALMQLRSFKAYLALFHYFGVDFSFRRSFINFF